MSDDFTRVSGHMAVLRRRGWIIAVLAVLGAIAGGLLAPLQTPAYSAQAVVLVPVPEVATDASIIDTQVQVVTSDLVVQEVVDELGLDTSASELVDTVTVEAAADAATLSITSTQDDPAQAARVANAFAGNYLQIYADAQLERQTSATAALRQQLTAATGRLVGLRQELPLLVGTERVETEAAIARQQQRQARLVDLLADARDPTNAPQPARVLQEAVAPVEGSAGRFRAALLGLVLGILIGAAIAYTRHHSDDRIRDEEQLVSLVGAVPVLGRIPRASSGRRGAGAFDDPSSKTAESYRGLAVNLRLKTKNPQAAGAGDPRSAASAGTGMMTLVISASPGEGKSSVARDLAITVAGMGLRVTLVDADLRNPQLANRFGVTGAGPGLTDFLQAGSSTTPLTTDVGVANLTLLPAGTLHADPAALLNSANVSPVWDTLRASSDLVVVDTAPVLYAAETLDLASVADRVVLVVERGRTTERDVRAVLERMDLVGVTPAGMVLTKVPATQVVGGYYPRQSEHRN